MKHSAPARPPRDVQQFRQQFRLRLRFGRRVDARASVALTSGGLLSVAVLVSGILLSTAAVVRAAGTARRAGDAPGG